MIMNMCLTSVGDWGFFTSYLVGGVPFVVLAIGSTNPGLLTFFIDKFSQVFPDYRDRVLRHEAGHFLVGYLLGVPVLNYDLAIGREHTDFAEAKLQKRLFLSKLAPEELDQLAVVAMAGVAAEAMTYPEVWTSPLMFPSFRWLSSFRDFLSTAIAVKLFQRYGWHSCLSVFVLQKLAPSDKVVGLFSDGSA
jgi:hypothetical protein